MLRGGYSIGTYQQQTNHWDDKGLSAAGGSLLLAYHSSGNGNGRACAALSLFMYWNSKGQSIAEKLKGYID